MRELARNWRVLFLLGMLLCSFLLITINGLEMGVDFKGGTLFQIHLAEKVEDSSQLNTVRSIIEQRMDSFGLKDTKVTPWGKEFIIAQIAETRPEEIAALETLLKTQGKFEATLDGNILFEGSDIIQIMRDPGRGYGYRQEGSYIRWDLPFVLKQEVAKKFSRSVFHRCAITSYDPQQGNQYDCDLTYFFIDRPMHSILVIPAALYSSDSDLLMAGSRAKDIPEGTDIEELLLNAGIPYLVVAGELTGEQKARLAELSGNYTHAIIPAELKQGIREELVSAGFGLKEVASASDGTVSWVWQVTGVQAVIALSPGITGWEPYVATVDETMVYSSLFITGTATDAKEAETRLNSLRILLETGSLPVPIDSISKEIISPPLGQEFLQSAILMCIVALVVVSLVIYVRYRRLKLVLPIMFTSVSEVLLVLGVAALIRWNLDLSSVAGIIAAVGTGVDDQIIITDELMRGEEATAGSLVNRVKRAFFIIIAAASTVIATMLPLILFGFGFGKLVGFAVTTIAGVLVGVLITRPAYGEIAKAILSKY